MFRLTLDIWLSNVTKRKLMEDLRHTQIKLFVFEIITFEAALIMFHFGYMLLSDEGLMDLL